MSGDFSWKEVLFRKKSVSLTSNKNFKRAYTDGTSFSSNLAVIYIYPNNLDYNRTGYSVTRKLGKAVVRNKIKRLFREAYRYYIEHLTDGYDIIFVARKAVLRSSLNDILKCFAELFKKSGLYKC